MKSLLHSLRYSRAVVTVLAFAVSFFYNSLHLAEVVAGATLAASYRLFKENSGFGPVMAPLALGANTLTGLIPTLYQALDIISRELVGFIPAVTRDAQMERAAVGQTVRSPITPAATVGNITPAVIPPDDGDQTIGYTDMTITKARRSPVRWNGEEQLAVNNNGVTYNKLLADQFAQSMRALTNEIESDLAVMAYKNASRAWGAAGTTPFVTSAVLSDLPNLLKILKDNGAPEGTDLRFVMNTTSGVNLRSHPQFTKVNEAGMAEALREGIIGRAQGFGIGESAGLVTVTKGTGSGYLVNNAGPYAVGTTAITVDTGTGTILAGDVITFAGDTNKYVVQTALAANVVTIANPGLRATLADNVALTVGGNFSPNIGFHRSSLLLTARAPALPKEGDAATDRLTLIDPISQLAFEISLYKQYRQVQYEVAMAWGVKGLKTDFVTNLLG